MSMKHIGTKILAGVLVVLLAGVGVLIWRNLPEDAPRLQKPEETVRQEPEVQPDTTATLCVAGDIVAHMPLVADAWNGEAYDFTHLFADARRYYEAADYTTACLETTFNGPPYSGYPQFCAPDALASGLKTVGFHLLSTASNHSMDTRYSGLVRTLDVLDAAGLEHVGTYRTQQERDTVKIIDVGGIKLAMLAYTFSTNGLPVDSEHPYCVSVYTSDYMTDCSAVDYDLIQSDLDKAGQSGADAIAVYVHWGNEYHTEPSEQQEQLADYLFAHGATLVLGGHAHVPQPMELRTLPDGRTGYLCYCLGNLISNQFDPYTNLTAAVTLTLTRSGETGQVTVSGAEYAPMFMLHASDSNEGRYRLLDIRKSMQDFEQGDTSVVNRSVYDQMKQGRSDLHRIFGTDEVLSLAA